MNFLRLSAVSYLVISNTFWFKNCCADTWIGVYMVFWGDTFHTSCAQKFCVFRSITCSKDQKEPWAQSSFSRTNIASILFHMMGILIRVKTAVWRALCVHRKGKVGKPVQWSVCVFIFFIKKKKGTEKVVNSWSLSCLLSWNLDLYESWFR